MRKTHHTILGLLFWLFLITGCHTRFIQKYCPLAAPYCGGFFPLNTKKTTPYGPPWADVVTGFLPCFGPYALCYYANCTPGTDSTVVNCPCESLFGLNFVEMSAILNENVYNETKLVCSFDPERCSKPNGAPVCDAINSGRFYQTVPNVVAVSDFSFVGFTLDAAIGTNCVNSPGVYAGCMATACYDNGSGGLTCICPTFNGPFQVGQRNVPCNIEPLVYSAAFDPALTGTFPTPPPDIKCFPDAGANSGNPIACPLYQSGTTLPPNSGVNCAQVCNEYNTCKNSSGIQLGYTCDTTICTTEKKDIYIPACMGLQNCELTEIFKAEFAAGCSCCASQLCGCTPNAATNKRIFELNVAQTLNGDATQCSQNGTLCGKP